MKSWQLVLVGGVIGIAGIAVGAGLFAAPHAVAQESGFRECIIARQESLDTNGNGVIQPADLGHTILIPTGYVPVGGAGMMGDYIGSVLLCRR